MRIVGHWPISRISLNSEEVGTESRCMDSERRRAFKAQWAKSSKELHRHGRDLLVINLDDDQGACERILFWRRCLPAWLVICLCRHQWAKLRFGVVRWDSVRHQSSAAVHKMSRCVRIRNSSWSVPWRCLLFLERWLMPFPGHLAGTLHWLTWFKGKTPVTYWFGMQLLVLSLTANHSFYLIHQNPQNVV